MLDVLASLFLLDITKTFLGNSSLASIAVVSQIVTISSVAAVVFGVLNGALSLKVNHKTLLLIGSSSIAVGSVGCLLAPSLLFMEIFYLFDGIGTVIVNAMAITLIGESLPLEQRAKSIAVVTAAGLFSTAMGFAFAGYIGATVGWRSYLLWYVIPISLFTLVIAYRSIPSIPSKKNPTQIPIEKNDLLQGFKEIFACKSAAVCLFSNMMMTIAGVWSFFASSFWRTSFSLPVQDVGVIVFTVVLVGIVGGLFGGPAVNLFGRKPTAVASYFARGLFIVSIVLIPNFWWAFIMSCFTSFVGGIALTSGSSLNLEQLRKCRGTMMSLTGVFTYVGTSIGFALAGLVIGTYDYQILGITLGLFGVVGGLLIFIFAKDPSKP